MYNFVFLFLVIIFVLFSDFLKNLIERKEKGFVFIGLLKKILIILMIVLGEILNYSRLSNI